MKFSTVSAVAGFTFMAMLDCAVARQAPQRTPPQEHALNIPASEMKWQRIFPEFGERSAEIAILHSDPRTGATRLMIRVPKDSHVPLHWHSANETHTIVSGVFVMECEGRRQALPAGSFNYIPSKMKHQAWTTPEEGALLFITVDGPWDVNWVNGPPKASDLMGGVRP
jgi:mannose-6-phosphate isomerase-like protein (cupin superfamily)